MSSPSLYFVYHSLGLPGTWATWFIDQHCNFSKSAVVISGETPDTSPPVILPNDIESIPASVDYPLHMNIPPYSLSWWESNMSYKEYINKATPRWPFNEKVAVNFSHHHKVSFLDLFEEESTKNFISKLEITDKTSIKLNIVLTVATPLGKSIHVMADRLTDLKQGPAEIWGHGEHDNRLLHMLADLSDQIQCFPQLNKIAPVYCLKIDKLLDHDRNEYENLCRAIGEDPLENWEELLEPMDTIFSRYKDNDNE